MRIISGKHKSKRISAPKNLPVRPTTDLAKESLFNVLNNHYYLDEIAVIDLFSGTGSICYEFASRGTEQITAVDGNFGCIKFINETSESFDMPISTIKSDVFKFLESSKAKATVIFADPPYGFNQEQFESIPNLVFQNEMLEEGGVLIVEHSKQTDLAHMQYYAYSKNYGGSVFSFFEIETEDLSEEE